MKPRIQTGRPFAVEPLVRWRARNRLSGLLDSSGECLLLLDSGGRIVRASRRASDLLGLAKSGACFFSDFFIAPSRDALRAWREESAAGSPRESLEATLQAGFRVHVSSRGIVSPQGHLLAVLEESALAPRGEQKSKQVEAELRSVLDSMRAGVLLIDLEGRVRFTNSRFAQMFGLKPRQLEPLEDFDELVRFLASRLRDPQSYSHPWRSFLASAGEPGHDEVEIIRPAQRVLERFSRPVLDAEGHRLGWIEVYEDITLRSTESKMFQKEKMAALGQLVSGIAHELNNPLTAIMGYTQLLLGHGLAATQLDEAKKIYQEAERARRIVKNLLFFARERVQERSSVDLNEVVERTLALRSYELKIESIQVETDLCRNLPRTMADPYQLQQVLLNLVVNAEQALLGGRGKGHIRIRTYRPSDSRIALEVEDDGPGIPQEIASRVFEPFFTTKPPGVGTGLGLSIVYGIVQQHGGDVILDSQRGVGAKIAVELPLVAVPVSEGAAQISQPAVRSADCLIQWRDEGDDEIHQTRGFGWHHRCQSGARAG
ncbi:MAG: ATP-binding protein [Candidatus Acidiferrales bacterium]